jgi:hypothetical protein
MTTRVSEYYPTQRIRKLGSKELKILLLSVCCLSEEHYIYQQHQRSFSPSRLCRPATAFYMWGKKSVAWVRERTIPTERPRLVGEISANF